MVSRGWLVSVVSEVRRHDTISYPTSKYMASLDS